MHYVIGDVHGCFDDMMAMIKTIEDKDNDAIFIFVGDFIDRGPKVWETLQWCMEHITLDGKYQSVLGNHEDLVMEWFYNNREAKKENIDECESTLYGFERILLEHGISTLKELKPIIEFWETMPITKKLTIDMISGKKQEYVIAHAYETNNSPYYEGYTAEQKRYECMWSRRHFWGYLGEGDGILVHGHTPTIDEDYMLRGERRPGFINYRDNAINVDGGCVYFNNYWQKSPCMLCAICLETFEEIYPYAWKERIMSAECVEEVPPYAAELTKEEYSKIIKKLAIDSIEELLRSRGGSFYRIKLLEKTGLRNSSNKI